MKMARLAPTLKTSQKIKSWELQMMVKLMKIVQNSYGKGEWLTVKATSTLKILNQHS